MSSVFEKNVFSETIEYFTRVHSELFQSPNSNKLEEENIKLIWNCELSTLFPWDYARRKVYIEKKSE